MEDPGVERGPIELTIRKWDVVDALRRAHRLGSLVQFLTPSTGPDMHGRKELQLFARVTTLLYATEQQRLEREDSAELPSLDDLLHTLARDTPVADIVFIDAWHSYDHSRRLLEMAMKILVNGGFIVVHDCDPPDLAAASPAPADTFSLWCGQTWRAFVDVTDSIRSVVDWFVVESDLGVGVIDVAPAGRVGRWRGRQRRTSRVPDGGQAAWDWLVQHRVEALRPMSVEQWQQLQSGPGLSARVRTSAGFASVLE